VSGDGEAAQTGLMHVTVLARFVFRVCDKRHTILPPGPEGGAFAGNRLRGPRSNHLGMGFNKRKMEDQRRQAAEKEAAARSATDAQVLEDAERLIAAWNERQAKRMPMLFSPTIGAAITAGFWFLWVRCPACRTTNAIDLRTLDRHRDAAVTSLIPALSCRSCRPNAPFAELVRLSRTSIADEMREERRRWALKSN
jgi:hypothetical protein